MQVKISDVKKLRQITGAGVVEAKKALEEASGDLVKAQKILKQRGKTLAKKKQDRQTNEGYVGVYQHHDGKTVGIVVLLSETDFVARSQAFRQVAHDLAMQVASLKPKDVDELMASDFIKQPGTKVSEIITQAIATLGENVKIKEIGVFSIAGGSSC